MPIIARFELMFSPVEVICNTVGQPDGLELKTTNTPWVLNADLFRIKIWDLDDGDAFVYDNHMDAGDDAEPTTEITGGSIVIPKSNK